MSIPININKFRFISIIEGISYCLLLFIGMPLKYGLQIREVNQILGMSHGILTIIFCLALYIIWFQKQLSTKWCIAFFIASLIPFGAFYIEKKLNAHLLSK